MSSDNTIFDDVFLTLLEKLPRLVIPLINEVFNTQYTEEDEVIQLKDAHQTLAGRRTTDSALRIRDKWYHIECQSTEDSAIMIRMIEYDFSIALGSARKSDGKYIMEFPRSCVLYLRYRKSRSDTEEVKIFFPDGDCVIYKVPVIRVQEYTKDRIFQKKLLFLLPFYIMRYEKEARYIENNEQKLNSLLAEYEDIRKRLEIFLGDKDRAKELKDLKELIVRIADYIFRDEERAKKGVNGIMRGKVLELESDRIYNAGMEAGMAAGVLKGRITAYSDAGFSPVQIAQKVKKPVEEIEEVLRKEKTGK